MPPIHWEFQLGQIYFNTEQEPDDLGCLWAMGIPDGWDSPPVRQQPTDLPYADGSDVPDSWWSARTIHGTGLVNAPNVVALEAAKRRLKLETRFMRGDGQFIENPLDGGPARFCTVRRLGATAFPQRNGAESTTFDFQLVAADPFKYNVVPDIIPVSSATTAGGLSFPLTFPITFTSDADADADIATSPNVGDLDAPFSVAFTGPLTNPKLIDRLTGQRIGLMANLPAARTVIVDTRAQTVILDGASVFDYLTADSTPLDELAIPAEGECDWQLLGQGSGQVVVTSRGAYE